MAQLQEVLGWSSLLGIALILWWGGFVLLAHDFVYKMHTKWFKITKENFDVVHYVGIAFLKILVLVFNIIPYLALRIVA